jgi:hypothetical protein
VGKVHHLYRGLKTKYLAERHEFEAVQGSPHSNFLKLKLVGEPGIWQLVQVSIG